MRICLGENIRALRKQRGLTQERLAETFGVSVGAVYKWEAGLSQPELGLIVDLADFFDTSVDALLGYEMRDNRPAAAARRIRDAQFHHDPAGVAEVEGALRKYPNSFEVVYAAEGFCCLMGLASGDRALLARSVELAERALALLPQNADPTVSEQSIYGHMSKALLGMGEPARAVELLKAHNAEGRYDDRIGSILASDGERPEDAVPFLSGALVSIAASLVQVAFGYLNVFDRQRDPTAAADVLRWAIQALDGLRREDRPGFLDKVLAVLYACLAQQRATIGEDGAAREALAAARRLAERFDAAPDYATDSLRFVQPMHRAVYDDMGSTALEAVERVVFEQGREDLAALWKAL